ncbi:hypothetical protein GCM10011324_31450 [Allosediminivita pacifica]|nr:hypothetical protein GCM10011324_31450 [Allosediminivita pacifica]
MVIPRKGCVKRIKIGGDICPKPQVVTDRVDPTLAGRAPDLGERLAKAPARLLRIARLPEQRGNPMPGHRPVARRSEQPEKNPGLPGAQGDRDSLARHRKSPKEFQPEIHGFHAPFTEGHPPEITSLLQYVCIRTDQANRQMEFGIISDLKRRSLRVDLPPVFRPAASETSRAGSGPSCKNLSDGDTNGLLSQ